MADSVATLSFSDIPGTRWVFTLFLTFIGGGAIVCYFRILLNDWRAFWRSNTRFPVRLTCRTILFAVATCLWSAVIVLAYSLFVLVGTFELRSSEIDEIAIEIRRYDYGREAPNPVVVVNSISLRDKESISSFVSLLNRNERFIRNHESAKGIGYSIRFKTLHTREWHGVTLHLTPNTNRRENLFIVQFVRDGIPAALEVSNPEFGRWFVERVNNVPATQ